jgi:hypothetical protein
MKAGRGNLPKREEVGNFPLMVDIYVNILLNEPTNVYIVGVLNNPDLDLVPN